MGHYDDDYDYDRQQERKLLKEAATKAYLYMIKGKQMLPHNTPDYISNKIQDVLNYLELESKIRNN